MDRNEGGPSRESLVPNKGKSVKEMMFDKLIDIGKETAKSAAKALKDHKDKAKINPSPSAD